VSAASSSARSAQGGQRGRGGFHRGAHLGQVAQQDPGVARLAAPAQHITVQQIPLGPVPDEGAAPLAGTDQPLGGEHLERLAQRGHAEIQLAAQRGQVQHGARGEPAGHDARAEQRHRLAVQPSARVAAHEDLL
jgi:hypothetical protein